MISNEELNRRFVEKIGTRKESLPPISPDWGKYWKKIANATRGIDQEHPCLEIVQAHIHDCDQAFLRGDWAGFKECSEKLMNTLKEHQ